MVVYSDYKNLLLFTLIKRLTDRQFRWLQEVYHIDIVIKHIKGKDNRHANTISQRPNLIHNKTEVAEDPPIIKTDNQGNLIPAEALISILFSIIENPIEIKDFKKAYPKDPRLKK